jgi:hypothetical protein
MSVVYQPCGTEDACYLPTMWGGGCLLSKWMTPFCWLSRCSQDTLDTGSPVLRVNCSHEKLYIKGTCQQKLKGIDSCINLNVFL